ncbi:hypothetical protein J2I47_04470 [Fibrella sp. HMF5335]|uniref:Outer membrane protein beta-barrel domain-containing protein n=1 Tax=Fibrella rubiginis TaxID=2817060 RepID=A0A939GFK0_9BACT|nr:hypothetical protein [Fibrella rubiginis]MBO0935796.1 hypothetical protein [Fibrella rubiginis]
MRPTLLLLCWLGPLMALAQNPYSNVPRYDQVPGYRNAPNYRRPDLRERPVPRSVVIKLNPFMLLGVDGAGYGGVEVPVGVQGAIQAEFGYGAFRSLMTFDSEAYTQKENWRGRLQYRWYNPQGGASDLPWYWAVEGTYKQVNALHHQTLGRDCLGGNCAYFQLVDQLAARYVVGAYGKVGKIIPLNRSDGTYRFLLDIYGGIGINYAWVVRRPLGFTLNSQYPVADYLFTPFPRPFTVNDRFDQANEQARALPDLQLGLTVGYKLNN